MKKLLLISQCIIEKKNKITFSGKINFNLDNKEVYNKFNLGDSAEVSYREIYLTTFDDLDKDGKKEQIGKVLEGYQFIDAQPKR